MGRDWDVRQSGNKFILSLEKLIEIMMMKKNIFYLDENSRWQATSEGTILIAF